ncbi:hypothetical protein BH23ACT9_BH23ACT9_25810 [soil metagenome]
MDGSRPALMAVSPIATAPIVAYDLSRAPSPLGDDDVTGMATEEDAGGEGSADDRPVEGSPRDEEHRVTLRFALPNPDW